MSDKTDVNLSEQISAFLDLCDACEALYRLHYDTVGECDRATTDFRHALELEGLNYKERAKRATAEQRNLIERRQSKNIVEVYEPFIRWFADNPETSKVLNKLKHALSEVRKVEKYHANRFYVKRTSL